MNSFRITSISFLLGLLMFNCEQNPKTVLNSDMMIVRGQVEGLRKGKLFLQKFQDSIMVNVDSTLVEGTPEFEFKTPLETAEVFYLYLDKEDGDSLNDRILFFGEKGTIKINTLLKTFESSAKITGSKNQELLQEYISFSRKFNDQNLELMKEFYEAQMVRNTKRADSIEEKMNKLLKRRYLYTINFAATNTDQNIAPYLALTEVYDANLALLDSIAVKMTPEVSESKYGKQFTEYLEKRRNSVN
ncbi:DUF4369 domain-containing protein [Flavobacteriaceae bacterium]|nr:DUF4369 domain-containing protein [Flavobacteriaceae bacterium]